MTVRLLSVFPFTSDPCPLLEFTAEPLYMDSIQNPLGRLYEIQPETWNVSTQVYVTQDSPYLYLFYAPNASRWEIRDSMIANANLSAYVDDANATHPQFLKNMEANWTVVINETEMELPNAVLDCAGKEKLAIMAFA